VGLTAPSALACCLAFVVGVAAIWITTLMPDFLAAAKSPNSVVGKLTSNGVTPEVTIILIMTAMFKTAFAEELLFRGLLGKRLIAWVGFHAGNFLQAALFGAIHLLIFLSPEVQASSLTPEYVVGFSGVSGWINGWINERVGGGSIVPGWIAHAVANLTTYLGLAYGLL
jgi:membrane protease YdiL (CAAX protease family)